METKSLFDNLPKNKLPDELIEILLENKQVKLERIISTGQVTPEDRWYDQETDEWVVLLQGAARLLFEEGEIELKPGDYQFIPAHQRHRVSWTDPDQVCVWLALHIKS